jgi:hypothetical protein
MHCVALAVFWLVGAIMMIYNLIKTIKHRKLVENEATQAPALAKVCKQVKRKLA